MASWLGFPLDRVGLDDRFGLCLRLGPSGLELLAVFERQPILVRGGEDSLLAAMAVDEMAEQLAELFQFEAEFLDLLALRREESSLRDRRGLRANEGLASFQVVRDFARARSCRLR